MIMRKGKKDSQTELFSSKELFKITLQDFSALRASNIATPYLKVLLALAVAVNETFTRVLRQFHEETLSSYSD